MKKLLCLCAILMLVLGLSVVASAAPTTAAVVGASETAPVPGEMVVVTVSLTGCDPVRSCKLVFDYDSAVFEPAIGAWMIAGDSRFDPATGTASINWETAEAPDGQVFMLNLKVRKDAVLGDTTINCVVAFTDEAGAESYCFNVTPARLTVSAEVCHHTYVQNPAEMYMKSEATCTAPAEYYESCTQCGAAGETVFTSGEPIAHLFTENVDEACLVTPASCTTGAVYKLSCPACGEMSEETFVFGEKLAHVLVENADEKYLDPANPGDCTTPPQYFLSCEACGEAGTVTFTAAEPWPHEFVQKNSDENLASPGDCKTHPTYYVSCSKCGQKGEETFPVAKFGDHVHDYACDTLCKVCGEVQRRDQAHVGAEELSSDETGHWIGCTVCSEKMEFAAHIPGAEATPEAPQTCTACGFVLAVHESHVCEYVEDWFFDDEEHWHECIQCGGKADKDYHIWEIERVDDLKGEVLKSCAYCGATKKEAAPQQTEPTTQPNTTQPTTSAGGDTSGRDSKDVLVIVLGAVLALSLIGNGVLIYFVITLAPKKKPLRQQS